MSWQWTSRAGGCFQKHEEARADLHRRERIRCSRELEALSGTRGCGRTLGPPASPGAETQPQIPLVSPLALPSPSSTPSPFPHTLNTPESTHPLSRAEVGIPDRDLGQPETSTLHSLHALQMRPKLPLQGPESLRCRSRRVSRAPSRTVSSAPCPGRHTLTLISSHMQFPPHPHTGGLT